MNFDPYPTYKASALPQRGDMPQHWEVRRLRTMVEMRVSNVDKHTKEEELPVRLCNYLVLQSHIYPDGTYSLSTSLVSSIAEALTRAKCDGLEAVRP